MISSQSLRSKKNERRKALKSRRQFSRRLEQLESRQLLASLAGEVWADTNGDGIRNIGEEPAANIRVYIDANDDGQLNGEEVFTSTNDLGEYVFNQVDAGTHVVRLDLRFGQDQSSPRAYYGSGYFGPNLGTTTTPTQLFEMSAAGVVRQIGTPTTDRIHGLTRVNSGDFFGVNFLNDSIYRVDPYTGVDTLLRTPGEQLTPGLAYNPATDKLYTVGKASTATSLFQLYEIKQSDGTVTPIGPGLTGFQNISDLTFDTANDRIVGFDNGTDKFFSFDTNGNGQFLADASRALDSWSLAFNGTTFVMFDRADPDKLDLLQVNPDTGVIAPLLDASTATPAEALDYPTRGDVAHRVTVQTIGAESGLNFGVIGEPIQPTRGSTLFINEILSDPLFGNNDQDSYLEIRGEKNAVIPDGTYLAIIEERGVVTTPGIQGSINGIFDLSNITLGANGFLVILPQGSPHTPHVDSSVLQSSTTNFGGLPGGIYTDVAADFSSFYSSIAGNGYLLFQTNVTPNLRDDIDTNDDGVIDPNGIASQWDILDSVSQHSFVGQPEYAYGKVVFVEEGVNVPTINRAADVEVVITEGHGYVGRIGDSTGNTAADWVGGTVRDERTSAPVRYGLESGILGIPLPMAFMGRDLDHVGESNFVGGVRGTVALQPLSPDQTFVDPAQGVEVLADTNRNGRKDVLSFSIDPNDYPLQTDFINLLDGVTFNSARGDNTIVGFPIRSVAESPFIANSNRTFSQAGVGFFPNDTRFRADFYRPARSVSIVGISGGTETYIRLDAYDANDNLVGSTTSNALFGSARQRLTVSSTDDVIAYAVAYSANDVQAANGTTNNSSPFAKLDSFTYTQSEATAVSDQFGFYELTNLFPDEYQITFLNTETNRGLTGAQAVPIEITRYENFVLSPNLEPAVEDLAVVIAENTPVGTSLGALAGSDDGPVTFNIVDGAEHGLVIDPATGELIVGPNAVLDFESTPTFNVFVGVTDELGATVIAVVTVQLQDVNETPVIIPTFMSLPEDTPSGTAIGQIRAVDPDVVQNQILTYTLVGGSGAGAFSVHPTRGVVTLEDASQIDFEQNSQLTLTIRVSDDGVPQESITFDQIIVVNDTNDRPKLIASDFSV
ncbi:MAG: hypothetical protein HKN47_18030, partial [Pirellulaceae bacterium]|nr:hypothetical protein [Pirellulaceae bacterium]